MAGLGAAAGAFEGDNARAEQALKNKQINQRAEMFAAQQAQHRADMELAQINRDADIGRDERRYQDTTGRYNQSRKDALDVNAENARRFDVGESRAQRGEDRAVRGEERIATLDGWAEARALRGEARTATLDERGEARAQRGEERTATLDERTEARALKTDARLARADDWANIINQQQREKRELEYKAAEESFSVYKDAQQLAREQRDNQKNLYKGQITDIVRLLSESPDGKIDKEAIALINEKLGTNFSQIHRDPTTGQAIFNTPLESGELGSDVMPVEQQETALRWRFGDSYADSWLAGLGKGNGNDSGNKAAAALSAKLKDLTTAEKHLRGPDGEETPDSLAIRKQIANISRQIAGVGPDPQTESAVNKDGSVTINGKTYKVGDQIRTKQGIAVLTVNGFVLQK